jgi:predicted transcriptional regulator
LCNSVSVNAVRRAAETTFTFRVDEDLKTSFTSVAKAHDRPGSQLLRDFMRQYVEQAEHDACFCAEVEQGLREPRDPNVELIPHGQVKAEWELEKADLLARIAARKKR